jgi:GT2 family glycosyltransferase/glycosyltransferase involved in cell wall biosynthesis
VKKVDIVIPIYDGYEETRSCLLSVLHSVDFEWARIILVNDCSPNPRISEYLRELSGKNDAIVLHENTTNLGFVATANRGMAHDTERDVLLLNSDVEVAGDWLVKLREAAYFEPLIGSITPFSNNATICSFPNLCEDNRLVFGLSVAELNRYFAETYTAEDTVEVPTGVGFCMYVRRDCLDKVGYFDLETFGKGYGEENDWCQRAAKLGLKNVHLANCFVYHKGGVSFGAEHNPRITRAQEILDAKYPRYHSDVQSFIAADAARSFRVRAIFGLFAQQEKRKVLLITHKLGGGAQQHVDELASLYEDEVLFVQITPDKDGESIVLSCFDNGKRLKDGLFFNVEAEYELLQQFLLELGIGHVHFHHAMGLHPRLWGLASNLECSYDLTVHDYYIINGNPTLTDEQAHFVSEEAAYFDAQCAGHYPLPPEVSAHQWRENQKLLVEGADRVIFPSQDCFLRFRKFFDMSNPIVAWHPDYQSSQPYPEPSWAFPLDRPLKVLVLGALSREKGADQLEAVAAALRNEKIEFHLLGYAYRGLSQSVVTHGPYDNKQVYALVEEIQPDVVWYPALWPESYSYTLSIALHCGLPVVVPNIGAFVERVQDRPLSVICKWNSSEDEWTSFWIKVLTDRALPESFQFEKLNLELLDTGFYGERYLQQVFAKKGELTANTMGNLQNNYHAHTQALTRSERILAVLWKISRSPLIARLISLIPFRVQRAIKRRFSSKPMHDIVGN